MPETTTSGLYIALLAHGLCQCIYDYDFVDEDVHKSVESIWISFVHL